MSENENQENSSLWTDPVMTLLGDATMTILTGAEFEDPGATAVDSENQSLEVMTIGSVDSSTPGSYRILYSATDENGRTSVVARTVTVVYRNSSEKLWDIHLGAY